MRHAVTAVLVVSCICSMPVWGQNTTATSVWHCTGADDEVAAETLETFLKANGVTVSSRVEDLVTVELEPVSLNALLQPRLTEDGLDRICIYVFFQAADQYQGTTEMLQFANSLNQQFNLGGFYMDEDGDLAFQTILTFIDTISADEITQFLQWVDVSLALGLATTDEWDKYLQ